jgi:hypothetical protein
VDADAPITNGAEAYGKDVWSWHPDAGVKFALSSAGDGGKRARSPGSAGDGGKRARSPGRARYKL